MCATAVILQALVDVVSSHVENQRPGKYSRFQLGV
jgi:hypothetical protein